MIRKFRSDNFVDGTDYVEYNTKSGEITAITRIKWEDLSSEEVEDRLDDGIWEEIYEPPTRYRLDYTTGNDYHCGCCRRTWDDSKEFDSMEELKQYILDNKYVKEGGKIIKPDWYPTGIFIIKNESPEDLLEKITCTPEFKKAMEEHKDKIEKAVEEFNTTVAIKKKKENEKQELAQLAKLKEKYEK